MGWNAPKTIDDTQRMLLRLPVLILVVLGFLLPLLMLTTQVARGDDDSTSPQIFLPVLMTAGGSRAPVRGNEVYYIAPYGNDSNSGLAPNRAWASFGRAWKDMYPGDTLILMDGVYYQTLQPNKRNGLPGAPITIKAQNDGKAIIDGEGMRVPVMVGEAWPGPIGDYFVIEGIVAQNSSSNVYEIMGDHNIFRRVSGYNAWTDGNAHVFNVGMTAENNLIEDCIAAGTGRIMMVIFGGSHNTIRRCFVSWSSWDGRNWHDAWPWGDGIKIYNADYNTIENSIAYGNSPTTLINIIANASSVSAIGNKVLGSIALYAGMNLDGSLRYWGCLTKPEPCSSVDRPQPTQFTAIRDFEWPSQRVGFKIHGSGELRDNLYQDIFSYGNAGLGLSASGRLNHPNYGNNRVNHATLVNNGIDNPCGPWPCNYGGVGTDATASDLSHFSVTNSFIETLYDANRNPNNYTMNGAGARLKNRYVDGVLTNQPLWPWPMQSRIQKELGISVANTVQPLLSSYGLMK